MSRARPAKVDIDARTEGEYDDVPGSLDEAYLFGITRAGTPFYYDADRDRVLEGTAAGAPAREHDVPDGVRSFVEEIENRVGWDVLGDENGGSDGGRDEPDHGN